MPQITCLRCKQSIDSQLEQCPHCTERVTPLQRTYGGRLIDGKYQIIERLGVGGMGEIFKVRHIHLNELRVIKIMRSNVAQDDQGLQRFLQEARTSTQIKHRNLAMLYDFAQLEDNSYYMVWEFIDGTNIQKWIAQNGPVPPRLTAEISIQALMGLDHLHSMGLIHRDVSPENIMLSQDRNGKLLVKVIDFGIAKSLAEGDEGQGLTQTGMFLGKLKYASPEQAGFLRDDEHLDPRSDLYSFGIVMYEMLAGRAPFQATNPHAYILKHVQEAPPPLAQTNPSMRVPANLEAIVMRALQKKRDERFAAAAEFASALEAIRNTISPDQKYGLGERMVTLSGAQTLADAKMTMSSTSPGGTMPGGTIGGGQQTQQTQQASAGTLRDTKIGSNDATMITRAASDEATMMERLDTQQPAAPTMQEAKAQWTSPAPPADATIIEKQVSMAPATAAPAGRKSNVGMIAGIAAVLLVAIIGAAVYFTRKPADVAPVATNTVATSGTDIVSSTAPPQPIPSGQGVLLLSATPWGDLDKIVGADQQEVQLPEDSRSTPARIALQPGKYTVTVSGPARSDVIEVQIKAGELTRHNVDLGKVDYDQLAKEMQQ
ncbi:MAG TPA: serine/threonine-protein kinase [Thermoanaerobaculia bacterium]|jgi:serine/threonine-protein kinase